jgi:hypothetical protein
VGSCGQHHVAWAEEEVNSTQDQSVLATMYTAGYMEKVKRRVPNHDCSAARVGKRRHVWPPILHTVEGLVVEKEARQNCVIAVDR